MLTYSINHMNLKSEKSFKDYLKTLPDDTIIKYYLDVEFTPFPVILIEEYTRRFKQKTKNEIFKDLTLQTRLARKKTHELDKLAKKHKLMDEIIYQKSTEIIKQAKKKGFEISDTIIKKSNKISSKLKGKTNTRIKTGKNSKNLKQEQLDLLKKLNDLKKAGILTTKEFQNKKKKIISKI
jgi:hypothetical protein